MQTDKNKDFKEKLDWLRSELNKPKLNLVRTELGKLLKSELTKLGHWKNKARGKYS